MANTVGSYKNIHWQKKWIPIKSQLSLNKKQRQLIIGSLFGDGNYSGKRIDISTYAFSLADVDSIQTIFRETFGLKSKYYRDRDKGYRMFFDQINTAKLIRIIFPFIVPSMMYKVTP